MHSLVRTACLLALLAAVSCDSGGRGSDGTPVTAGPADTISSMPLGAGTPDKTALLKAAAEGGDAIAQVDLGSAYLNGDGVARDPAKAAEWWERSASQGNAKAQVLLAAALAKGDGMTKDVAKAMEWAQKAAAQGDAVGVHLFLCSDSERVLQDGEALLARARSVASFRPKDQFDQPPDAPDIVGKPFCIVVEPSKPTERCLGSPAWEFSEGSKFSVHGFSQYVDANDVEWQLGNRPPIKARSSYVGTNIVTFSCAISDGGTYEAQNSFGVRATVQVMKEKIFALASDVKVVTDFPIDRKCCWTKVVTGDDARQLAQSVRVRIRGKVAEWANRQPIACGKRLDKAKLNFPYETAIDLCLVRADVTAVEVVDVRSGEVVFAKKHLW